MPPQQPAVGEPGARERPFNTRRGKPSAARPNEPRRGEPMTVGRGEPGRGEPMTGRAGDPAAAHWAGDADGTGQDRPAPGAAAGRDATWPSPAERRARVVKARRRALLTLLVLTAGAVAMAVTHLAASWVIAPPAVMLAGLLLLLREAARTDAERARPDRFRRTQAGPLPGRARSGDSDPADSRSRGGLAGSGLAGQSVGVGGSGRADVPAGAGVAGRVDVAVPAREPDAEVIDISAHISDQVYDQYSDAAERAVGD